MGATWAVLGAIWTVLAGRQEDLEEPRLALRAGRRTDAGLDSARLDGYMVRASKGWAQVGKVTRRRSVLGGLIESPPMAVAANDYLPSGRNRVGNGALPCQRRAAALLVGSWRADIGMSSAPGRRRTGIFGAGGVRGWGGLYCRG